jgi:hypothetical protein
MGVLPPPNSLMDRTSVALVLVGRGRRRRALARRILSR